MNLHAIKPPNPSHFVRLYAYGMNGHAVGRDRGAHVGHVYRLTRNSPPPFNTQGMRGFMPWPQPYGLPALLPLCGSLNTRARHWYLRAYEGLNDGIDCPDCAPLADHIISEHEYQREVMADPFNRLPYQERLTAIDPVTGE